MDVSACPLLRQLYLTDVCGVQGWIRRGKLLVRLDVGDKVHIIFCLTEGRKWKWQLGAQCWLWFWCEMEIEADSHTSMWNITARLLCVSKGIFLWSVIFVLCCTPQGFNVWTHPSLHVFVPVIESSCFHPVFHHFKAPCCNFTLTRP